MFFEQKIVSLESVTQRVAAHRAKGETIVAISGSFDVLHAGHLQLFDDAKKQGDVLVVFLNSDISVRSYKGPTRPFMDERHRSLLVAALTMTDYVVLFDELTPLHCIGVVRPDVFCNGLDWGQDCIERDLVESYGGRMHVRTKDSDWNPRSSDIISRIQAARDTPTKRAVFFDRDGVLIEDKGYVHSVADVSFMPGVFESLKLLQDASYELFVVTNQSGIGRGMYPVSDMLAVHEYMNKEFAKRGITISGFYFCPHAPDDGCDCRKPGTALLTRAAAEHTLSLDKSWMVGDKSSDIECGRMANARAILVDGAYTPTSAVRPNFTVRDVSEAARVIVNAS